MKTSRIYLRANFNLINNHLRPIWIRKRAWSMNQLLTLPRCYEYFPTRLRSIDQSPSLLGFTIIDSDRMTVNLFLGQYYSSPPLPKPLIASQPPNENFALDSVLASRAKLSDADRINMQIYSDIVLESLDLWRS